MVKGWYEKIGEYFSCSREVIYPFFRLLTSDFYSRKSNGVTRHLLYCFLSRLREIPLLP